VFSVNDMLYNASFVVGAAACAGFMPDSGHSVVMLLIAAAGYLVAAAGYWFISLGRTPVLSRGGDPPDPPGGAL
jgi:hypothetical protein